MPETNQSLARQQRREITLGYRVMLEQHPLAKTQLSIADVGRTLVRRKFLIPVQMTAHSPRKAERPDG